VALDFISALLAPGGTVKGRARKGERRAQVIAWFVIWRKRLIMKDCQNIQQFDKNTV